MQSLNKDSKFLCLEGLYLDSTISLASVLVSPMPFKADIASLCTWLRDGLVAGEVFFRFCKGFCFRGLLIGKGLEKFEANRFLDG